MGGTRPLAAALCLAWLTAACSEPQNDLPTTPSFARPVQGGCNFITVNDLVKTEFGASSAESGLATDMKNYGSQTSQATYVGYRLLDAIADKYDIAANQTASRLNASNLTKALLDCMNIGDASVPSSFETALGPTGAFAVRGLSANDADRIAAHGTPLTWIMEPPADKTWLEITELTTPGLDDSVNAFLAYGQPGSTSSFTDDQFVGDGSVFDWSTIPVATFSGEGAVIAECSLISSYIQHNEVGDNPEVLGFVKPSCYEEDNPQAFREAAPRNFAERLLRLIGPQPAYATLLATTGTGSRKTSLSPFGVIHPGEVDLDPLFTWKKSGNTVGKPFTPTPEYQILTRAGTEFKQDYVLIWLEAIGNSGAKVAICNNWAYTDANGRAVFPNAFLNKAGGYTIVAKTTGTVSKPNAQLGEAPTVPPGQSLLSPLVNVKNGALGTCGSTYVEGDPLPTPP